MLLVTGGAGFLGSNFILQWITEKKSPILNFDRLTLDGNLNNLSALEHHSCYRFVKGDLRNRQLLRDTFNKFRPSAVVHFAGKMPSEHSPNTPEIFLQKNALSTFDLLDETLHYWRHLSPEARDIFRFINVSSSEVYGLAKPDAPYANEETPYAPMKPFAASKASADHFVRAYNKTYGLPTITTYCSNNFGPFQFPTKLIPLIIINAMKGSTLDIHGEGKNRCPWLYVGEHCSALRYILANGLPGETYNIGGQTILTNQVLIEKICSIMDDLLIDSPFTPHSKLMRIVKEHTKPLQRRILDDTKLRKLGWQPKENFDESLRKTIHWYLHNIPWIENVLSGDYKHWLHTAV